MLSKCINILMVAAILFCSVFAVSGCSAPSLSGSTPEEEETPTTRLTVYTEDTIKNTMDGFKKELNTLKANIESGSAAADEDFSATVDQLKTNLESFDDELKTAVKNGKLTEDVKKSYDESIETMKTDLNSLNDKLEGK